MLCTFPHLQLLLKVRDKSVRARCRFRASRSSSGSTSNAS